MSDFFHLAYCVQGSFICSMNQYFIPFYHHIIFHCVDTHFVYPSLVEGCLKRFDFATTMNNIAMNIHVWVFVWIYIFIFPEYLPRSEVAGLYNNQVLLFEELPDCFPKWLYLLTLSWTMDEGPTFSTHTWTLVVVYPFNLSHDSGQSFPLWFEFP